MYSKQILIKLLKITERYCINSNYCTINSHSNRLHTSYGPIHDLSNFESFTMTYCDKLLLL
jgi:hypothetical protein